MAFSPDDFQHLIHVLFAGVVILSLHHHPDDRLSAGLPHQDATGISQGGGSLGHGSLDILVVLGVGLVGHPDIFQHLGIEGEALAQLGEGLLLRHHHLHHHETGEDAVTGGGVLGEDDVSTLLAAQTVVVQHHVLVDVLVPHLGLGVLNAQFVKGLVQAEITHEGGDHGVAGEQALFLHVLAADIEDVIAGDDVPLFVHAQAPVSVPVIGKAHIQAVVHHELLQHLDMGGAGVLVDVEAIRLCVDDVGFGAQGIEHGFGDVPGAAVGAVQADALALEGVHPQADEIAHIPVPPGHIVHGAADLIPLGQGQLLPVAVKGKEVIVQISLHQPNDGFIHLLPGAVNELDAVVVVGVVAGGDHNAAVKILGAHHVGHGGRGGNVEQVGIRPGGNQAAHQRVFKHIAGAPGVLADDDFRRFVRPGAVLQLGVVPAQEAAHLEGVVSSQGAVGLPTEAVGSKVFSHFSFSLFLNLQIE